MDRTEADTYFRTKFELAQILTPEERQTFFVEEHEPTSEAKLAYIRDRVAPPLGLTALTGEASSQDKEVVPVLEVEDEEAQAIVWAHATAEAFRENSKGLTGKQRVAKDRQFALEMLKPGSDDTSVLQHADFFLSALDVWRAQARTEGSRAIQMVDVIVEQARANIRNEWATFDHTALSGYIKAAASNRLSSGTATNLLRSYFQGPKGMTETVSSFYQLAQSVLDLSDNYEAFKLASKIINFDTDIALQGSKAQVELTVARTYAVDNTPTMERARAIHAVAEAAKTICNVDGVLEIGGSFILTPELFQQNAGYVKKIVHTTIATADEEVAERLIFMTEQLIDNGASLTHLREADEPAYDANLPSWYTDITVNSKDPLLTKLRETIGPQASAITLADEIGAQPNGGYKVSRIERLILPNGFVIDIYLPHGLMPNEERAVMERVLEDAKNSHADTEYEIMQSGTQNDVALSTSSIEYADGKNLYYVYRKSGNFDGLRSHSINELLWIGLPYAEQQSDNELIQALVEVQDNIETYQHRFLNRRGIRINFDPSTQLGMKGYKSIVFREDPNKPQNISVQLTHGGNKYTYALDGNFNLDLGGKTISSARLRNQIHYTSLLLLRDYVCGIVMTTEDGELASTASGPLARIDYLKYLPDGQMFTPKATRHYLERRKKDLLTKSEERKRVDPQQRNSTYVREVEQVNLQLPPLTVFVDPDDFIYERIIKNGFKLPPDMQG